MFIKNTYLIEDKFDFKCEEYINALISSWFEKNYEMMFAKTLNLEIEEEADALIKKCINNDEWCMDECLTKYHGVFCAYDTNRYDNDSIVINKVAAEIRKGNPIVLVVDTTCIKSIDKIDKRDPNNIIIVTGICEKKKEIYFRMTHGRDKYINMLSMSYSELVKSTLHIRKYANIFPEMLEFNLREFLAEILTNLNNYQIADKLKATSIYIKDNTNRNKIFNDFKESNIKKVPLIYNMALFYRSRNLFSFCLAYLAEYYDMLELKKIADYFAVIGGKYYNIRGLVLKCYFEPNSLEDNVKDISEFLMKIHLMEADIIKEIQNLDYCNLITDNETKYELPENVDMNYIDIEEYFNNKAFSRNLLNKEKANFDGMRGFFLDKKYPYGKILEVSRNMKFKIAKKRSGYDNISSIEQEIIVEQKQYTTLMILASACHGSFKDYIYLNYDNGEIEKLLMLCSSFWYPKAHFREENAWNGKYAMYLNGRYYLEQRHLNLYANSYPLNPNKILKSIKLPNCPDMHIFAITLC